MQSLLTLLPLAAVTAVLLFVLKELLEFFRRRSSDVRRVRALKVILGRECESHFKAVNALRHIFFMISSEVNPRPGFAVSVGCRPSGKRFVRVLNESIGFSEHIELPEVNPEPMSKHFLEVATLDSGLLAVYEPALDGLLELDHYRQLLRDIGDVPESIGEQAALAAAAAHGLPRLDDIWHSLATLYTHCTGQVIKAPFPSGKIAA
jgi:hypothetical protein